jgi:uncharacterized membrane protein YGL010W
MSMNSILDPQGNSLVRQLAKYGTYHQDHRNVATHFVGIPMILVALMTLLSRPGIELFGMATTPAVLLAAGAALYYLALDLRLGAVMALFLGGCVAIGSWFADQSLQVWLSGGLGLFVAGWAFQFVGHYLEGQKPAFLDDLKSLLIGPLFVVVQAAFAMGLRHDLKRAMAGA